MQFGYVVWMPFLGGAGWPLGVRRCGRQQAALIWHASRQKPRARRGPQAVARSFQGKWPMQFDDVDNGTTTAMFELH